MITETSAGGIVYIIIDGHHQFLLVRHAKARHWGFPKGHIGDNIENEPMDHAALREVAEEGGIKAHIVNPTPIETTYFFRKDGELHKKTVNYYLMAYVSGTTDDHDHEVSDARFFSQDEAWDTLTYNTDKEAFSQVLGMLNKTTT